MIQLSKAPLFVISATLVAATAPSWSSKPIQNWTVEDAKQILSGSPWVKKAAVALLPSKSEDERRIAGKWGGDEGIGIDSLRVSIFTGANSSGPVRRRPKTITSLEVRWESALPVRTAEQAAHEDGPPAWEGDMYAIAVYDVPGLEVDDKGLPSELKRAAALRRDGKKDLRPVQVELLPQENDLTTVVYLFPRSAAITLDDKRIEFDARIGRLSLAQYFYPLEMQFQGKLEL